MVSSLTEEAAIKKEAVFTQLEFSHDLLEDKVRPTPNAGNRIKNRCLFLLSSLSPLRNMRTAVAPTDDDLNLLWESFHTKQTLSWSLKYLYLIQISIGDD